MTEEKKLDEKTLEDINGGLSGGPVDGMYASLFYRSCCLDCTRAHKDCPYHDDQELIYRTWNGSSKVTCHS